MLMVDGPALDAEALREQVQGTVVAPGDDSWDVARQAWNLAVDQRPALVVVPENEDDVMAVVTFARDHGLRVAPQGTGHNAAPLGSLERTILLKTSAMRSVEIDVERRRARVGAGALWAEVTGPASEHGLAPLAGSSPDVGVVGYTLGGGLSWLGRRYGLACNSVVSIDVVTADGRLLRADRTHEPDLFWALRGGTGSFGIVTAIEIGLVAVPEVYAGALLWPWERAGEVLRAWAAWCRTAPETISSSARILQLPPLPDIPEHLRGRSFVAIDGAFVGDAASGEAVLRPLRALEPEMDVWGTMPPAGLVRIHMDPEHPVPAIGGHMLLEELSDAAIDTLVAAAGPGSGSPLLSVELRHLGGALRRRPDEHGALATIDAAFSLFAVGVPVDEGVAAAIGTHLDRITTAMRLWDAGRRFLNFAEERVDLHTAFPDATWRRLRAVKAVYDPMDRIASNHPVPVGD
jgi:FAD binding domain